jgi:cytochrome c551/c552
MLARVLTLALACLAAGGVNAMERSVDEVKRLLQEHKCTLCHAEDKTKAGPAFVDIAWHYRNVPRATEHVASVIRRGQHGGGPWHMPPHPELSPKEARAIARYILSLE